jgi:effector-binding domain-containing protein
MDYDVVLKEVAPEHLASVRGVYPIAELPEVMGRGFAQIMSALNAEGIQPAGGALSIYHGWTEDTVDVEIAFTIKGVFFPQDAGAAARRQDRGGVKASMVPGGRVLFAVHVGPYDQIAAAYGAIQTYAGANGLKLAGKMWERYLTDPAEEPDLSKHVTEVFWPVET